MLIYTDMRAKQGDGSVYFNFQSFESDHIFLQSTLFKQTKFMAFSMVRRDSMPT